MYLKYYWFSNKQFVNEPIINWVPKSTLKRITHLLTLYGKKWIPSCEVMSSLLIWSSSQNGRHIESATKVILTHANQKTSPHRQEFITHSWLRSSHTWSSCEILISLINRFINRDEIFRGPVLYKLIVWDTSTITPQKWRKVTYARPRRSKEGNYED